MRVSRKEIAQALRAAKEHRCDGVSPFRLSDHHIYICSAIEHPYDDGHDWARCRAVDVVQDRLGGHYCIENYLRSIGVPDKDMTSANIQTFRHRWLDALILEFGGKND